MFNEELSCFLKREEVLFIFITFKTSSLIFMIIKQNQESYVKAADRRGSRGNQRRSRSRSRSRGRNGLGDSGEDYETLGSDTETEHGEVSSRTESSNQLDDITSLRDPSVIYSRSGKDHRRVSSGGISGGGRVQTNEGCVSGGRASVNESGRPPSNDGTGDSVYGGAQTKRDVNPLHQRIHHSKLLKIIFNILVIS